MKLGLADLLAGRMRASVGRRTIEIVVASAIGALAHLAIPLNAREQLGLSAEAIFAFLRIYRAIRHQLAWKEGTATAELNPYPTVARRRTLPSADFGQRTAVARGAIRVSRITTLPRIGRTSLLAT